MKFSGPERPGTPTIAHIAEIVARAYDMQADDMVTSRSRVVAHVEPRQITQYLAHLIKGASFQLIARFFNCNHTNVLSNCRKIAEARKRDPEMSRFLDELTAASSRLGAVMPPARGRNNRTSSLECQVSSLQTRVESLERILGAAAVRTHDSCA